MANWYVGSTKWTAVTAWAASTAYSVGALRRQLAAPTVGNERVFRCTTAGTSGGAEPTWVVAKGATTNDGTAVWTEVTGQAIYNGDGGGSAWGAPHARLANALTTNWAAAGDNVFVSETHAETQTTGITITGAGTPAQPISVVCIPDATIPPVSRTTGASIASTATGANITINSPAIYIYGLEFKGGSGAGASMPIIGSAASGSGYYNIIMDSCKFTMVSTAITARWSFGAASSGTSRPNNILLKDPTFVFASTSQRLSFGYADVYIQGGTYAATGSVPTVIMGNTVGNTNVVFNGTDLSSVTGTIFEYVAGGRLDVLIANCKIGSGVAMVTGAVSAPKNLSLRVHNSDSAATNYRVYKYDFGSSMQQETTIVRSGGASHGSQSLSWAVSTGASANLNAPFATEEIMFVVATGDVGVSKTATIEIASNTQVTDAEAWLEITYPSSTTSPLGATVSDSIADSIFGTPTNQASSTETWESSPTYTQKLSVTFTPQMAGAYKAKVYLAKPSVTVYVDPLVTLS